MARTSRNSVAYKQLKLVPDDSIGCQVRHKAQVLMVV